MVRREPGAVIVGLGLLAMGGWLILRGLGAPLLGLRYLWPALPALFGVALLAQNAARSRRDGGERPSVGLLWMGTAIALSSALLGAFSLQLGGLAWADLFRYWPAFLLIAAAAFLLVYVALTGWGTAPEAVALPDGLTPQALLTLSYLLGAIALTLLPVSLGLLRPRMATPVARLAPLGLVAAMLVVFVVARLQQRSRRVDG